MRIPAGPLIGVAMTAVLVVVAEVLLGWIAPFPDPYLAEKRIARYVPSAHAPDVEYGIVIEDGLPGVQPRHPGRVNIFSTNNYGFRGDELVVPKPADELRVFIVGGSSTECLALDDSQDMSRVLQEQLNAAERERASVDGEAAASRRTWKVYNAGKSGDRSYDHLAMISQRIAHLEPDVVVVFAGINDLLAGMFQVDYLHMQPMELSRDRLLRLLASDSQIFRRTHSVARRFLRGDQVAAQQTIAFKTSYGEKAALQRSFPEVDDAPPTDLPSYERNLRSIVGIARAAGARVVLMTQATTWAGDAESEAPAWHWMRLRLGKTFAEGPMDAALERYNDVMRTIAAQTPAAEGASAQPAGADTAVELLDLSAIVPKTLRFFHDDVHFNVEGARFAATALEAVLADGMRSSGAS